MGVFREDAAAFRENDAVGAVHRVDENAKKSVYRKKSGTQDKEGVLWAFSGKTVPFSGKTTPAEAVYRVDDFVGLGGSSTR